jgi:hypothetical protein
MSSKEIAAIKDYAETFVKLGYQKDTTPLQQRASSIFSVLYTGFVEEEMHEGQPKAVYDFNTFRRLIDETKTSDGRE